MSTANKVKSHTRYKQLKTHSLYTKQSLFTVRQQMELLRLFSMTVLNLVHLLEEPF